jgi:hypothetical protein
MIRLDIAYEKRMSLGLDLWIVMMTFPTIAGLIVEAIRRRSKDAAGMTPWVKGFALAGRPFAGSKGCVDPADDHHRMRHTADVTGS